MSFSYPRIGALIRAPYAPWLTLLTCSALIFGCDPEPRSSTDVTVVEDPIQPLDDSPGVRVSKPTFKDGHQEVIEGQNEFILKS